MIQKCFVGDKVGNFIRIEGIMDKNVLLQNIAHYVFYVGMIVDQGCFPAP